MEEDLMNEPEFGGDNGEESDSYQENLCVEGKDIFSLDEEDVSDSSDVSFNPGESDSEVAEEYDSNYSTESDDHDHNSHNEGDENGADMSDCKMNTANKQRKNRKVKVRRKNRKSKSVKKGSETGMIMMAPGELDINKPRPPMLAFMIWISTIRDDIKKENPEASYVKVAMIAAERWHRMEAEEKTKWKEKAQKAKEDYKIALEEYLKNKAKFDDDGGKVDINNQKKSKIKEDSTIEKTMKNSDKPKRPMSSYMIWLSANRDNIKKENPEASSTKLLKIAGGLWHGMEGKEKTKWNKEAKKAMGNYKVAMNEYLTNKPEDSDDGGEVKMYQMRLSVRNIKSKSKACDKENDDASSFSTRKGEKDVYLQPRKNDTVVTEENSKKNKKGLRRSSTKKTTRSKAGSGGRSKKTHIFTDSSSDSDDSGEEVKRYQEKQSVKNILRKSMAHYNEDDDAYFYLTLKRREGKYGAIEDDEDDFGSDSSDGCFYPGESGSEVAEEYDSNPPTSSSDSEYYSMASQNERDDSRREGEAARQTKGRKTNKKNSKKKTKSPQKSSPKKATRSRGGSGRRIKWTLFGRSTDSDSDTPPKKKLKKENQKEKPIVRKKKNERKRRK